MWMASPAPSTLARNCREAVYVSGEPERKHGMADSFGYKVLLPLNGSLVRVPLLESVCNVKHEQDRRQNVRRGHLNHSPPGCCQGA